MQLPLRKDVSLLGSQRGYWALDKPEQVRSHPNKKGVDPLALLQAPYDFDKEAYQLEENASFFLLNRLDAPTSGVLIGTPHEGKAQQGRAWFEAQEVTKLYLAWVFGHPNKPEGLWNLPLKRTRVRGQLRVIPGGRLEAQTAFKVLDTRQEAGLTRTLLQLQPLTGRTHQLRVHCAEHNLPILGDKTYGHPKHNRSFAQHSGIDRLLLHAWSLQLPGATQPFISPPPEAFL